ncbi:MAG: hypothetical protein LPJ89_03465 [Hymenobacteraceae bacterium]|nr:hypothetical protein [Hymenobacteraceae bacterium]
MKKLQIKFVLIAYALSGLVFTGCSNDKNQMEEAYEDQTPVVDDDAPDREIILDEDTTQVVD